MIDPLAIACFGMPPTGLGVYGRDRVLTAPFKWRAVNAARADDAAQVGRARALGGSVWLWSGPDSWRPENWRATLANIVAECQQKSCAGFIADPENGWPDLSRARLAAEMAAFGAALGAASRETRVGVTSYPTLPGLETLASNAGMGVWGSPQMYGRTSTDRATMHSWYARWTAAFGPLRVIPSIAGWVSSDKIDTDAEFRAYLAALPKAPGAIVWPAGELPAHIMAALADYNPGGSLPGTAILSLAAFALRPIGAVLIALLAVAVAFAIRML